MVVYTQLQNRNWPLWLLQDYGWESLNLLTVIHFALSRMVMLVPRQFLLYPPFDYIYLSLHL